MNYITGGTIIKGGQNNYPSQITQRPPPPKPTRTSPYSSPVTYSIAIEKMTVSEQAGAQHVIAQLAKLGVFIEDTNK
jgi:hypothetical protein